MRLSRSPLKALPAMVSTGSILTWVDTVAGRWATSVQTACGSAAGKAEAGTPTRTDAYLARVKFGQSRSPMAALRQVFSDFMPWQSKSVAFSRLRHGRQVHRVCRRRTVGARRDLPLNLCVDPATVRACSLHLPDHPPLFTPIWTTLAASTRAVRGCSDGSCLGFFPDIFHLEHLDHHPQQGPALHGVQRCAANPRPRIWCPISPPADYSHLVPSLPRCLEAGPDGAGRRGIDGRGARPHCRRRRHRRRPRRRPPPPPTQGTPLGCPAVPVSPCEPRPTLTLTYSHLRRRRASPASRLPRPRLTRTRSTHGRSRAPRRAFAAAAPIPPLWPVPGARTRFYGRSVRPHGYPGRRRRQWRVRRRAWHTWSASGGGGGPRGGRAGASGRLASAAPTCVSPPREIGGARSPARL